MDISVQLRGIDVSHHNGSIDWAQVAGAGCAFAYIKATDGIHFRDPLFAQNWEGAEGAGVARGAYHFFRPAASGAAQAGLLTNVLEGNYGRLPIALDVEVLPDAENIASFLQELQICVQQIAQVSGRLPWIYTSRRVWTQLGNPIGFQQCGLWIAHWGVSRPALPSVWNGYAAWQITDDGRLPGIAGPVDLDVMNSSIDRNAVAPQAVGAGIQVSGVW